MAKNILSLQLLRNSQLFTGATNVNAYDAAVAGITGSTTNDGTIKLARYQFTDGETTKVKTIFGIFNEAMDGKPSGYTIYDGDSEVISDIISRLDALDGGGQGEGTIDQKITSAISALDYTGVTTGDSVVVTNVTETDGVVSATSANVGSLKLDGYTQGSDTNDVAATDTINQALAKLQNQIDAANEAAEEAISGLDATITAETGYYINKVDEVDGKISGTTAALPTVAAISSEGQAITAVSQSLGTVAAQYGDIAAAHVTVADADSHFTATTVEGALAEVYSGYVAGDAAIVGDATTSGNTLGKLEDRIEALDADAKEYTIKQITTGLSTNVKEAWGLFDQDDHQSGATINIYKDSAYKEIYLGTSADTINATTGEITKQTGDKQSLNYAYMKADGTYDLVKVDVSAFLSESEFQSGVTSVDHIVRGVVDPTSETFLTVGAHGFKLSGVQDAIDAAVEGLDVTGDTAVAGQYVAAIEETDGVVAVKTRANVSEAVLNNYAKGSDATDIASTDTVNQALSKLENQIDAVETQAAASKTLVAKDANASHLTISSAIDSSNSAITFTIGESDIASKTDLDTLSGKAVTAVEMTGGTAAVAAHTDGTKKITINADGSTVKATGYAKGNDSSAIVATDSINAALAKLENQIEKAQSAATTVVTAGTSADTTAHLEIASSTDSTTNATTYTVDLKDVASAAELDAVETAVGLNANGTYSADTSTNYVSAATSVADAIKKLDTQVKANADAIDQNDVASTNSALTVSADTVNKTTNLTVNVSDKSYDVDATTLAPTAKNNDVVSPIFITNDGITFASVLDCGEY